MLPSIGLGWMSAGLRAPGRMTAVRRRQRLRPSPIYRPRFLAILSVISTIKSSNANNHMVEVNFKNLCYFKNHF